MLVFKQGSGGMIDSNMELTHIQKTRLLVSFFALFLKYDFAHIKFGICRWLTS